MMNVVCTQNMWHEGDQPGGGDQQGGTHPDHLAPQMGYMLPPAKRARILEPRVSQLSLFWSTHEYPLLSDSAAVAVWLWLCCCCLALAPLLLLSIWLCCCCCLALALLLLLSFWFSLRCFFATESNVSRRVMPSSCWRCKTRQR